MTSLRAPLRRFARLPGYRRAQRPKLVLQVAVVLLLGTLCPSTHAETCGCGVNACPTVGITEDNASDLGCGSELVGSTLVDSDADGLPDVCDPCACTPNAFDEDTGRYSECSASSGPRSDSPIHCVDGRVVGTRSQLTSWFLRPTAVVYTRSFDSETTRYTAGALLVRVGNLDRQTCVSTTLDGRRAVEIGREPEWFWRTGVFAAAAANVALDLALTAGAEVGIDYAATASMFSVGPTLHVMTEVFGDDVPLYLGLGVRGGLIDAIAVTPFFQLDLLRGGAPAYGLWLNFDWGMVEDLGVRKP